MSKDKDRVTEETICVKCCKIKECAAVDGEPMCSTCEDKYLRKPESAKALTGVLGRDWTGGLGSVEFVRAQRGDCPSCEVNRDRGDTYWAELVAERQRFDDLSAELRQMTSDWRRVGKLSSEWAEDLLRQTANRVDELLDQHDKEAEG